MGRYHSTKRAKTGWTGAGPSTPLAGGVVNQPINQMDKQTGSRGLGEILAPTVKQAVTPAAQFDHQPPTKNTIQDHIPSRINWEFHTSRNPNNLLSSWSNGLLDAIKDKKLQEEQEMNEAQKEERRKNEKRHNFETFIVRSFVERNYRD